MSDYGMSRVFNGSVEEAEAAITDALKNVGFGMLTRIDVADTLKKKIDYDRAPYVILGACNPKVASQALEMEEELGLLLPCNVIVYESGSGETVVSVIEPEAMLSVVRRDDMSVLASEIRVLLNQALNSIQ
ncbi:MAG TPA: DUF302 domain-containing protein [Mariprofundaceae bacterium]|nr:DUF302 domain-containing protein [Mariprofundaceae bacterium]